MTHSTRRVLAATMASIAFLALTGIAGAHERPRSAKALVESACGQCHVTGEHGAPRIGDEQAWAALAAGGLTGLTDSALAGIRNMPPHGGDMTLSDVEIEQAITYMVNQSGGQWVEPVDRLTPAVAREGKEVVRAQCAKCHETSVDGAPKIGDREAWVARFARAGGVENLVNSAIHGHGPMPARGALADLTDAEIRAAILYMYNPGSGARD
jgi:cytochrome c5